MLLQIFYRLFVKESKCFPIWNYLL
jgi:hypothetical protein